MALFFGVILILCTIALLILAIRQHKKISEDTPFDDSNRQIDFNDFYSKLRKFVSNEQEKIYAVLGIKNADNLLTSGIQENGFCILTDKAVYFIGKVYQKKWLFATRTNIQHRIIAGEMKGINVGTLSHIWMLFCAALSVVLIITESYCLCNIVPYTVESGNALEKFAPTMLVFGVLAAIFTCFILAIYFVLHAFFLKRTNICIEFTSLTVAFMVSELGRQEIKDFYKAVSEVQELNVNVVKSTPVEQTFHEGRQRTNVSTNKIGSLSELSKMYENGMLTKEEFETLKREIIGNQQQENK